MAITSFSEGGRKINNLSNQGDVQGKAIQTDELSLRLLRQTFAEQLVHDYQQGRFSMPLQDGVTRFLVRP